MQQFKGSKDEDNTKKKAGHFGRIVATLCGGTGPYSNETYIRVYESANRQERGRAGRRDYRKVGTSED